jgi:hypothetical protein
VEKELREFTLDLLTQRFNIYLEKKGGKKKKGGVGFEQPEKLNRKG